MENIWLYLSFDDIVSLNLVCQRFSQITRESGRIWKHLLWTMYPGASLLKYPVKCQSEYANEETSLQKNNDIHDESNGKYNDSGKDINSQEFESPKIAKKICLQIQNTTNYWKRQFGSRHSIGIHSKSWVAR